MEAADTSGGKFRQVTDTEILAAQRELACRDGVFVEPASAAGVAGLLLEASEGVRYAGQQVVVTVTGHGLKDIDTALSSFTDLVDTVCDADVDAAAARRRPRLMAGRERLRVRRRAGHRRGARRPAPTSGPGFDCLGLALELADTLVGEVVADGLEVRVDGRGRATRSRSTRRHLVVRAMRAAFEAMGCSPPGLQPDLHQPDPAQPRAWARPRPPSWAASCWRAALVEGGADLLDDGAALSLANRLEGHPDNVAPALLGGFVISGQDGDAVWAQQSPVDPSVSAVVFVPPYGVRTEVARGLLPETVPHADAAANSGRAALLVAALGGHPAQLLRATEDFLHQRQREPAMPESLALVARPARTRRSGGRLGRRTRPCWPS